MDRKTLIWNTSENVVCTLGQLRHSLRFDNHWKNSHVRQLQSHLERLGWVAIDAGNGCRDIFVALQKRDDAQIIENQLVDNSTTESVKSPTTGA